MSASRPPDPDADMAPQDEARPQSSAQPQSETDLLGRFDIMRLRAPNAGPLTLSGTNAWIVGHRPAWIVDPGPMIDSHVKRLLVAIDARGGLGGIALTHDHADHAGAVASLRERFSAPLAAGRGDVDVTLKEGARFGPFEAVATPGHAPDHFALVADRACFTGDAVLGEGSVFISPDPGAMSGYMLALARLRVRKDLEVLCPGHGPPVWDAYSKLQEYLEHRRDRENALLRALGEGRRSVQELLDAVWSDVPDPLRALATVTLAAHLDKLDDEKILPTGVERPKLERADW